MIGYNKNTSHHDDDLNNYSDKKHHDEVSSIVSGIARILAKGNSITYPPAYIGRCLRRHVSEAEADEIMRAARHRADRAQEAVVTKNEGRTKELERISIARCLEDLGLDSPTNKP